MIPLAREVVATARSHPVASLLTVLMIVGMVLTVMLTTGRTVGAEQEVLGSIDSMSSRAITIRGGTDAGLTSGAIERIAAIDGVEWVAGFSIAVDATNSMVLDGHRVPLRKVYSQDLSVFGLSSGASPVQGSAWASAMAMDTLGLADGVGGVTQVGGNTFAVMGTLTVPEFLVNLEPLLLVPSDAPADPIGTIIVIAESPNLISPVTTAAMSVLSADDPTRVTVETSAEFADLRAIIEGQFGIFSRSLVLVVLGLTGALVAVLLYGLVMMRRKDFGRRRALGATRGFIVSLVLAQTGFLALVGMSIGFACSIVALLIGGYPLPGVSFSVALAVLTMMTALIASTIPAVVASRRDPVAELRVP